MASESPFDRHGGPADPTQQEGPETHQLSGSQRETLLQIAHQHLGEWREWRRVAETSELEDAVDLFDRTHVDSPVVVPFELDQSPTTTEDENLTDELGVELVVHSASPELDGEGLLEVTDVGWEAYEVTFQPPSNRPGASTTLAAEDLHDVDGAERTPRLKLTAEQERYYLEIEITHRLWMVLWLRRELPIQLDPRIGRHTLVVPDAALPAGRGE
ncbi:MAG: hypothetical protein ABEN55_15475 [Bradymonadaceae bacterium]